MPSPTGEENESVKDSFPSIKASSFVNDCYKFFAAESPIPQVRTCETAVKSDPALAVPFRYNSYAGASSC